MTSPFYENIKPHVLEQIAAARLSQTQGQQKAAFKHLETAHVLGQSSTRLHVLAHTKMLLWAIDNRSPKEMLAQLVRIVGAATKTWVGFIPSGNTGGANVSAFATMPLKPDQQELIEAAKRSQ